MQLAPNPYANRLCTIVSAHLLSLHFFYMIYRKHIISICVAFFALGIQLAVAQCSICTKTASQLGDGPASALNSAIIYLAAAPFAIMGYIGWRWWKNEKELNKN